MKMQNLKFVLLYYLLTLLLSINCGIESNLINLITKNDSKEYPKAQDNIVTGFSPAMIGGWANSLSSGGEILSGIKSDVNEKGLFSFHFPGNSDFNNIIISIEKLSTQVLGIIPSIKKKKSVFEPPKEIFLGDLQPVMSVIDNKTTTIVLLLIGKSISDGKTLQSIPPSSISDTITEIDNLINSNNQKILDFLKIINELIEDSKKMETKQNIFNLKLGDEPDISDLLNDKFLKKSGTKITKELFREKILDATMEFQFKACYDPSRIKVVFMVDFRDGNKDGNCFPIDKFKWSVDKPNKKMYFTGAVHEDTPVCTENRKEYCIIKEKVDEINKNLGNWKPNVIEMFDDGTHGDGVKDDLIYTISYEMPYIPTKQSPDGRGLRIGYKYTWGSPSQGWTGSEEWPGNQRLLEIEDENGDHIVLRYDYFGDETTNKDKMNLLTPANGGCGINIWEAEKKKNEKLKKCASDTRENMIDSDGDCKKDTYPKSTSASPITLPCK